MKAKHYIFFLYGIRDKNEKKDITLKKMFADSSILLYLNGGFTDMIGVGNDLIQCLVSTTHYTHYATPTYLDPIIVRISNESNVLHAAISQFLDKLDTKRFKTLAGLFNVIHKNGSVAKTTTHLGITVGVCKIRLILCAPVTIIMSTRLFLHVSTLGYLLGQFKNTRHAKC